MINTRAKGAKHEVFAAKNYRGLGYLVEIAPRTRFRKDFYGCVDLISIPTTESPEARVILTQVKTNANRKRIQQACRELDELNAFHVILEVQNFKKLKTGWHLQIYKKYSEQTEWELTEGPVIDYPSRRKREEQD